MKNPEFKPRIRKPLLCKIGLHKPDKLHPVLRLNIKGRHKWRTTHIACKRCGKLLYRVTWKQKEQENFNKKLWFEVRSNENTERT